MGNGVATARVDGARATRLSPKVRRLLREHRLDPDDVRGTGPGGRITPADVERQTGGSGTARPPGRPGGRQGPDLASPLARRLLRAAGLVPGDVLGTGPGRSVTGADATRAIEDARTSATTAGDVATLDLDVDLTRLLLGVSAARDEVRRRTGVELTALAPITHAACRSLRRHPVCNGDDGTAGRHRDVDLGLVTATGGDGPAPTVPTVACAQDLTVTALAERIAGRPGADDTPDCTFTIAEQGDTPLTSSRQTAGLRIGPTEQRSVTVQDEFGNDAVTTRWQATLRLTYDPRRVDETAATAFLDDLRRELETVDLLTGAA